MKSTPKKKKIISVLSVLFLFISTGVTIFISSKSIQNNTQDTRTDASANEPLWNFVIISDTHSRDRDAYEKFFAKVKSYNPKIVLHGGDVGWSQNDYSIHWGDYRYHPMKGTLELAQDSEVHFALGNHDVVKTENYTGDNHEYYMQESLYENFCEDKFRYWGGVNQDIPTHYTPNAGANNYQYKNGLGPFNTEVLDNKFCEKKSTKFNYSFERAGIKFVIAGYNFTRNPNDQEETQWLRSEICNTPSDTTTIFMQHAGAESHKTVTRLGGCNNNLEAMFSGDVHDYKHQKIAGIDSVTLGGMLFDKDPNGYPHGKNADFISAEVYQDKIIFKRHAYREDTNRFNPPTKIFEIKGNFTDYDSPELENFNFQINKDIKFIGFPIKLYNVKASDVIEIAKNAGIEVKSIARYGDSGWEIITNRNGQITGDDFSIQEGHAYYINTPSNFNLPLDGTTIADSPDVEYRKGWNLISFPKAGSNKTAEDILNELKNDGVNATTVSTFSQGKYSSLIIEEGNEYGNNFAIKHDVGYWIKVD